MNKKFSFRGVFFAAARKHINTFTEDALKITLESAEFSKLSWIPRFYSFLLYEVFLLYSTVAGPVSLVVIPENCVSKNKSE